MRLNDVPPPGFTAPGKSLINEVEKLKEAVLLLCELQKQLVTKLDGWSIWFCITVCMANVIVVGKAAIYGPKLCNTSEVRLAARMA